MAKFVQLVLLVPFCVVLLPALASAGLSGKPFIIVGQVYCDTCRLGYETDIIMPIAAARVKIECKDRDTFGVKYTVTGVTNSTGTYTILVSGDREDDICDCKLVSSPMIGCNEIDPRRNSANIIVTRNNGMVSDIRNANSMGFLRSEPMSGCAQILKKFQEYDE